MTSIKEALKIIQRTIKGDQIEAAVVDVGTMMPLGKVVSAALAQLDSADAVAWQYRDDRWDDDRWHVCAERPRDTKGRRIRALSTALLPDAGPGNGAEKLARCGEPVTIKPLEWRDHRPDSFPEPAWSAQTPFGYYNIEEVSASDSPAYVVRLHAHHFVADKDSLEDAKAAAQADYERRIRSALVDSAALHSTSAAGETTSSDGGVLLDAYNGWFVDRLKARCRELVRAVSEWQRAAMSAASEGGNRLSNVIEPYKSKIGRMIEAYTDDDEPRPSEAIPADVREESSKQYRDAVDRVNRLTDREIANVLAMKEACHCFDDTSRRYCTDKHRCFRAEAQSASPEAKAEGEQHVATVTYTNWRGETSLRRIIPKAVRYGVTAWHPQPQWLMLAWDDDKQADREFALKDFGVKAEGGRSEPDSRTQK